MSESNFLAMTGLATQALFAALLAVLLGRFFRRHRRPYLREWSRAWWAFSLAQLGALYGLAQQAELPAAHWSRLLSSSLSLVGAYWHAAWLLFGVYAIASRRGVSRRGGRAILAALALLGVVSALLWAFAPGAAAERMLVRVGVRSLVLAFALLAAAVALWRAYRAAPETGPRFVALAFGLWGLQQLLLFGLAAGLVRLAFVSALGYLDVALIAFLGLATVVWLLEEEHHRLPDASGKAYWVGKLQQGMSRGRVMVQFSESNEYVNKTRTTPPRPARSFGDGVHTGVAGTWRNTGNGAGCYWERLSGFGGTLDDIIANDFTYDGRSIVTVAPGDAGFGSSRCGTWVPDVGPITLSPTEPFAGGTFRVGRDISPGTWRSSPGTTGCYWERRSGFGGELDEIIANDFADGQLMVTISPSDVGFTSNRCGFWTKVG